MAEHYVCFINAGGKHVVASLYEMLPEGDSEIPYQPAPGEEEDWQPTWTLQPRQYTVDSRNEYEFSIGAAKKEVKIPAKFMKKQGHALSVFTKFIHRTEL